MKLRKQGLGQVTNGRLPCEDATEGFYCSESRDNPAAQFIHINVNQGADHGWIKGNSGSLLIVADSGPERLLAFLEPGLRMSDTLAGRYPGCIGQKG